MVFHSAEIRWFDKSVKRLETIFKDTQPIGMGTTEAVRSDFYLKLPSTDTGIKIRQGNHELKLRSSTFPSSFGTMEQWTKWSYKNAEDILELIQEESLNNWIELRKRRWIKKYKIIKGNLIPIIDERVSQGCGFELTRVDIPSLGKTWFTLGLEAFSDSGQCKNNLEKTLKYLELKPSQFENLTMLSYPGFIGKLLR